MTFHSPIVRLETDQSLTLVITQLNQINKLLTSAKTQSTSRIISNRNNHFDYLKRILIFPRLTGSISSPDLFTVFLTFGWRADNQTIQSAWRRRDVKHDNIHFTFIRCAPLVDVWDCHCRCETSLLRVKRMITNNGCFILHIKRRF
jgi:hypothetical protein